MLRGISQSQQKNNGCSDSIKVHELQKFIKSESGSWGEKNVNYCLMGTKTGWIIVMTAHNCEYT